MDHDPNTTRFGVYVDQPLRSIQRSPKHTRTAIADQSMLIDSIRLFA